MQENWIGKSRGLQFRFRAAERSTAIDQVEVFTTRPDTIFGATLRGDRAGPSARRAGCRERIPRPPTSSPNARGAAPAQAEIETAEKKGFAPAWRRCIRSIRTGGCPSTSPTSC